jgi:hypothetical protein
VEGHKLFDTLSTIADGGMSLRADRNFSQNPGGCCQAVSQATRC